MAIVRPFRGLRYNAHDALSLALVTAPPYDCISPAERDELYRTHPHNVVRLILGKDQAGDGPDYNKYTRAADLLAKWVNVGILARDPVPAFYFYQQEFLIDGRSCVREGFLARVELERFGEGRIYPHEETMAGVRDDRLRLIRATRANLSPVFSLFPDPANEVTAHLRACLPREPLAQTVDGDAVVHRLFAVTDLGAIERAEALMADRPLFVADGHHRYETAVLYRDELRAAGENVGPDHPAASVLMLCVSMDHPGLAVLPTHRIVHGLPDLSVDALRRATEEHFQWQEFTGAEATSARMTDHLAAARGHAFGLWTRDTTKAFVLTLKSPKVMDRLAADHSKPWRKLDVAILQRVLFGDDLARAVACPDGLRLSYVHLANQAFDAVHEDGADAAFVMRPLPVRSLQDVAAAGERMPAKSTYFYPKALSGLVINPLD